MTIHNSIQDRVEGDKDREAILSVDEAELSPEQAALKGFYEISDYSTVPRFL